MKTITRVLLLFSIVLLAACEGEQGPPGIPGIEGPPGEDGYNILGTVFPVEGTFSESNDYTLYYAFPDDFTMYDGDVVMVYLLWEQADGDGGGVVNIWRPLPQTAFLDQGILQYNFDFTNGDVQIYLEGTIDKALLSSADTDDQSFRIAVIPAELIQNKSVDLKNYNSVLDATKLSSRSLKAIQLDQRVKTF